MKIDITKYDDCLTVQIAGATGRDFYRALSGLKAFVSAENRSYDEDDRTWTIDLIAEDELDEWIEFVKDELRARIVFNDYSDDSDE